MAKGARGLFENNIRLLV